MKGPRPDGSKPARRQEQARAISVAPGAPIRSAFPGGPTNGPDAARRTKPRLRGVAQLEEARARTAERRKHRARGRRTAVVLGAAALAAFSLGLGAGFLHRATQETLTQGLRAAHTERTDMGISREVNRTLLELWKMEELEFARGRIRR